MSEKLLLVDLDGVVVDLMGEALRRGLLDHPACRWNVSGCCTWRTMNDVFESPGLFDDASPIENAVESVKELMGFFRVHFLSTPWPSAPESAAAKYRWVERYFGDPRLLTLAHDKTLVPGFALVDDNPALDDGPWDHIIAYPQAWNESSLPTWSDDLGNWIAGRFS